MKCEQQSHLEIIEDLFKEINDYCSIWGIKCNYTNLKWYDDGYYSFDAEFHHNKGFSSIGRGYRTDNPSLDVNLIQTMNYFIFSHLDY